MEKIGLKSIATIATESIVVEKCVLRSLDGETLATV